MTDKFVVRLWDMFDGWIDITPPLDKHVADEVWNEKTNHGRHHTKYGDGDYYAVFPADTQMLITPNTLGR